MPGVGRIDGLLEGTVFYEVDGDGFHSTSMQRETDRQRDSGLLARGHVAIRLGTRRVDDDWPGCVADVLAALVSRLPTRRSQEILRRVARIDPISWRRTQELLKTESNPPPRLDG